MHRKKILCLDFDGVLHKYVSPWTRADEVLDGPVDGAIEFLILAVQYFDVQIFSSRSHQNGGHHAMREFIEEHTYQHYLKTLQTDEYQPLSELITIAKQCTQALLIKLKFPKEKPPFSIALDDRTITFNGIFPEISTLLNFKPWNKQ